MTELAALIASIQLQQWAGVVGQSSGLLPVNLPAIPAGAWEILFGWMPFAESCSGATCTPPEKGVLVYLLVGIGTTLTLGPKVKSALSTSPDPDDLTDSDSPEEDDDGGTTDAANSPADATESELDDSHSGSSNTDEDDPLIGALEDMQQRQVRPSGFRREYDHVRLGEAYRRQMYVEAPNDGLTPGILRPLIVEPTLKFDLSIHITPKKRSRAEREAKKRFNAYDADIDMLESSNRRSSDFAMSDKQKEAQKTADYRDQIKEGQKPFEYSIYISARGDSEEELNDQTEKIRDILERNPIDWTVTTVEGEQMRAAQSVSPLGKDVLSKETDWDPKHRTLGKGIGGLIASLSASRVLEPGGVELGEHAINGSPIIKDPFKSETNYNCVVIGDSGSGKSFDSKLQALRTWESRDDTKLIMLDPLDGFHGIAKALDAEHVTVGGDRTLNPLDIKKPDDHALEALPDDYNALVKKEQEVLEFFDSFFALQNIDIGNARPLLGTAIREAYSQAGITQDIETHDRPSPTISDVLDVIDEMANDPEKYTVRGEDEREDIRNNARELKGHLRLFVDGQFQNLNGENEFNMRGEDVVYVDLSQQEGQSGGGSGLMMQLMFSLIYEQAKQTPDNVVFIIDEARFLMRETESLEFLGQRVRHSRHFDTSIRFITQNIGDFFSNEEAESIINNSFMFFLHRTKEVHDWTEEFGINEMQADYIEDAETGDRGYSEALVRINDDWYPLKVSAMDREAAVVDFDPREDDPTNLPGLEQYRDNKIVKHIRKELRHGTRKPVVPNGEPPLNGELFVDSWQTLSDDERRKLDLLNGPELESVLDQIAQGKHPRRAVNESVERKVQSVLDVDDLAESDTAADQTEQINDQQGPALQTTD